MDVKDVKVSGDKGRSRSPTPPTNPRRLILKTKETKRGVLSFIASETQRGGLGGASPNANLFLRHKVGLTEAHVRNEF